jgi:hypothetical protein
MALPIVGGRVGEVDGEIAGVADGSAGGGGMEGKDGAGGGGIAGKRRRGRGQDCREEDGAGGGWSGGTVRVVDALAPALRCSRDVRRKQPIIKTGVHHILNGEIMMISMSFSGKRINPITFVCQFVSIFYNILTFPSRSHKCFHLRWPWNLSDPFFSKPSRKYKVCFYIKS